MLFPDALNSLSTDHRSFVFYCSKSESTIRVVRVQLNDGERVVGVRYPKVLISEVEKVLKEQKMLENYQQQVVYNYVFSFVEIITIDFRVNNAEEGRILKTLWKMEKLLVTRIFFLNAVNLHFLLFPQNFKSGFWRSAISILRSLNFYCLKKGYKPFYFTVIEEKVLSTFIDLSQFDSPFWKLHKWPVCGHMILAPKNRTWNLIIAKMTC